jgi:DNA-binding NarL/FixJ family response regulator
VRVRLLPTRTDQACHAASTDEAEVVSMTNRNTTAARIEQAVAYGRSYEWMETHLGATNQQILNAYARIEAAHRNDEHAYFGDGTTVQSTPVSDPDRGASVRELAAKGLLDREIGARLGMSRYTVRDVRKHFGIPPGKDQVESWSASIRADGRARKRGITSEVPRPGSAVA